MASHSPSIAGATVTAGDTDDDIPGGDSLVNLMISHRLECSRIVRQSKIEIWHADKYLPPHLLEEGDVVYYACDPVPFQIIRVGYGHMLDDIRVRRLDEASTYTAGRWLHYQKFYLLEIGDNLTTTCDIEDSSEERILIHSGASCSFSGYDSEGDVILDVQILGAKRRRHVIWFVDLRSCSMS